MLSVWKRMSRLGKRAFKCNCTIEIQNLTIECARRWQPNRVRVVFSRHGKKFSTPAKEWEPGDYDPLLGLVHFVETTPVKIEFTLFETTPNNFEDKRWKIYVESLNVRPSITVLAHGEINFKELIRIDRSSLNKFMRLKCNSKKILKCSLIFKIQFDFVRLKTPSDLDMNSFRSSSRFSLAENTSASSTESLNMELFHRERKYVESTKANSAKKIERYSRSSLMREASFESNFLPFEKNMINGNQHMSSPTCDLLQWCNTVMQKYGVTVSDFTHSWKNGLPFCYILNVFCPDSVDITALKRQSPRENCRIAFEISDRNGVPRILDENDVCCDVPDKLAIMTYVYQLRLKFDPPAFDDFYFSSALPSAKNSTLQSVDHPAQLSSENNEAERKKDMSAKFKNPFDSDDSDECSVANINNLQNAIIEICKDGTLRNALDKSVIKSGGSLDRRYNTGQCINRNTSKVKPRKNLSFDFSDRIWNGHPVNEYLSASKKFTFPLAMHKTSRLASRENEGCKENNETDTPSSRPLPDEKSFDLNQIPDVYNSKNYLCTDNERALLAEQDALNNEEKSLNEMAFEVEKNLREAMRTGKNKIQEELMLEWFNIVNRKNVLIHRQRELSICLHERRLENQHKLLTDRFQSLLQTEGWKKTEDLRKEENELFEKIIKLVNERNELVEQLDFEKQQLEESERIERTIKTECETNKPLSKCSIQ